MRVRATIVTLLAALLPAACGGPTAPGPGPAPGGGTVAASVAPAPSMAPTAAPAPAAPPVVAPSVPPAPTPRPDGPFQAVDVAPGAAEARDLPAGRDVTAVLVRAGGGTGPGRLAIGASTVARRALAAAPAHHHGPIPPVPAGGGRGLLQARSLGATEDFWVNTGDFTTAGDRRRTCRRVGARAGVALYVDTAVEAAAADLDELLAGLADATRPRLEATFGPLEGPWSGGGTIVLVVSPAVDDFGAREGGVGYFWARDLMADQPNSNGLAAIFVSDDVLRRPAIVRRAVVAHEAAHLLVFARKSAAAGRVVDEEAWLSEGLATLAPDLVGAGLQDGYPHTASDVAAFQADPEAEGLMEWGGPPAASFGRVYTFARYLLDRHGVGVLRALADQPATGRAALEAALAPRGTTFEAVVRDWAAALFFAGDPAVAGLPWRWRGPALAGEVQRATMPGFVPRAATSDAISPRPWGIVARRGAGPGPWRIDIGAPADDRLVGTLAVRK